MIEALQVKKLMRDAGADVCGIAGIDRFRNEPEGFKPTDIYPLAKTVLVFGLKIPETVLTVNSRIPYTFTDDIALHKTLEISFSITLGLEKLGIFAIPIPSEPYDYWDKETQTGKGLLSLKQAGYLAGLGVIGRNSLLCNQRYGNLLKLGAVLANVAIPSDPLLETTICPDGCRLCERNCPVGAIGEGIVDQKKCRQNSESRTSKGAPTISCCTCRAVCPNRAGWVLR